MKWTTTVLYLATGISAAPPTFFTRPDAPPRVKLATPDPYAFNRLKVSCPHPQLDGKYLSADALGKVDLSPGPDGELVVCPFDFNSATGESKMRAFPIAELEVYSTLGVSVKNGSAELVTVLDPEPDESPEVDVQLRQSFVLAEGGSPQTMDLSAEGINWRMFHEGGNWTLKGDDGSLVFTEVHPPVKIVMERVNAGMVFRGRAIR